MNRLKPTLPLVWLCLTAGLAAQDLPAPTWDLDGCMRYAVEHNLQIKQNRIACEESDIDTRTARAALFPSLSFSTSHNLTNRPFGEQHSIVDGTNVISTQNKTNYTGNYGLNAQWTIYNGRKRLNTLEQQRIQDRMASLDVETQENSICEQIAQTYVQILYAVESVRTNENTLQTSEATYERARQLMEAGSLAKSDLAQLEAGRSADQYQLTTARSALQRYRLQLKQLLELEGETEMNLALPELDDADVMRPLPTRADVYAAALATRPEIEAGRLGLQTSDLDIRIAQGGYLPTVSLTAGIGTNHTTGSDFTFAEQAKNGWNNSVGLSVSVPIFNNRQTKSAVQKAKLARQRSQLQLQDQEKTLYETVEGCWLDATNAQQDYLAAVDKVKSAQASYDLVSEQFDAGMKNTVELLSEKNNLLSAKQQLLQAKYTALLGAALLRFYAGERIQL
ncbi:MAG: TolC family protein [Bacteroidaceae bacterium]